MSTEALNVFILEMCAAFCDAVQYLAVKLILKSAMQMTKPIHYTSFSLYCDIDAFSLMSLHGLCCCCFLFHLSCKMWFCGVCQLDTLWSVCGAAWHNTCCSLWEDRLKAEGPRGQGLEPPLVHVSTFCGLDWPSLIQYLSPTFFLQRSKPHGSQPELFPR